MATKIIGLDGEELQSYEEIVTSPEYVNSRRKEVESGTEAPEVLMPNSPLEHIDNDSTEETTSTTMIDSQEGPQESYIPLIVSACFGFVLGIMVAFVFFKVKIRKVKNECDTKVNEARSALDRMLMMLTTKQSD